MRTVQRQTVAEQGLAIVRGKILDGELRPGDRVTEEAMAKLVGVSRPTMREVFRVLIGEGLLTRQPTTRILEVSRLDPAEVVEIYAARRLLEIGGIRAAKGLPARAFDRLQDTLAQMRKAVAEADVYAVVRADGRCHTETVALTGNRYLTEFHSGLMSKLNLLLARVETVDPIEQRELLRRHQHYVDLIVAGDLERAEQELSNRLSVAEQEVLKAFSGSGELVGWRRSVDRVDDQ